MSLIRADKNLSVDRFGSGHIGHSDKNFISVHCSDYKSDTLSILWTQP